MRNTFSFGCLILLGSFALGGAANADDKYPSKAVRIIVPFSAGGQSDIVACMVGKSLGEQWGVPVVIDNRPGAGGNMAAEIAAKSRPDGYTLFYNGLATQVINPLIYKKTSFDPAKDLDPVIVLARTQNVLVVGNAVPANSVRELIELAKKKEGGLNFGSTGNGTSTHLTAVLFNAAAGVNITHIPYRGSPEVLTDMVGNRVQMCFDNIIFWAPRAKAGEVRALAVTGSKRSSLLPNIPTMQEAGLSNFVVYSWSAMSVPVGTPQEIVRSLNRDINTALASEEIKTKLNGVEIVGGTPEYFRKFAAEEFAKWGKVARSLGLQVD